jgi:hexosaminidase
VRSLFIVVMSVSCFCAGAVAQSTSPLYARGYTVLPEPQHVSLGDGNYSFDQLWRLAIGKGVSSQDVAIETLQGDLSTRFNVVLGAGGKSAGVLTLKIIPGSVEVGDALDHGDEELTEEAYRIDMAKDAVTITANASTGLFYGVETFVQLLRPDKGTLWFPQGKIEDWPDMKLRQIYWDDSAHLDRFDEIKRALKQAAFYKINGLVIKLEGHFQYKSAPAIVEPYALTPTEFQELTDYGLHYHVQLIPYLDGPAHIAFILKHPEYAGLREYPESNYELCATNPDSYKLLDGMYQDLLDANKGVKYFYLSTDEPYYLGLAHNSQCNEADTAKQFGSVGQMFAKYVDKTATYLHDHGREVIFWGEYPLKINDISTLPKYLINGEVYGEDFDRAFHKQGIRQMIFTSTEGEEKLFPDYFLMPQKGRLHGNYSSVPRVEDMVKKISFDSSRQNTTLIGEIDAGWGDEGIHPETFWLGYVAGGAAGWHPGSPNPQELMSTFYSLFYGPGAVNINRIYQLMSYQAQFWTDSWDEIKSTARKPIWGSSYSINTPPKPANDQALPLPPAPGDDLAYDSNWSAANANRIRLASDAATDNGDLIGLLHEDIQKAQFNRYNLNVYLSIAQLYRQNLEMIAGIHKMDTELAAASQDAIKNPQRALNTVDSALDIARSIRQHRNEVLKSAEDVWYQSWFPRVPSANGRVFLHDLDDVKDHLPDRTVDLSYLVYREKILPFGVWVDSITAARNRFAAKYKLPLRSDRFEWESFDILPSKCLSASDFRANQQLQPQNIDQASTCGLDR